MVALIYNNLRSELQIHNGSISGCYSNYSSFGKGNTIYNSNGSKIYLPTSDSSLFSITVPNNAVGTDNGQYKYGYPGIYDENTNTLAEFLYYVQFDFNGGIDSNGNASIDPVLVMSGETLGDALPTNLTKTVSGVNFSLNKWIDGNKNVVTSNTTINNNNILHARYETLQTSSSTLTKSESGSAYRAEDHSN